MVIFPVRYVKLPEAISAQEPWQTYVGTRESSWNWRPCRLELAATLVI